MVAGSRFSICLLSGVLMVTLPLITLPAQGTSLYMTTLSLDHLNIENAEALYQCYSTGNGAETTFQFGRTAPIPSASAPDPPDPTLHIHPKNGNPMVVKFSNASWGNNTEGFGPFYCNGTKDGYGSTQITTFFMRSDAKFTSGDDVFTRTVSVGDSAVTIEMDRVFDPDDANNTIQWRLDGGSVPFNTDSMAYTTQDPVQPSDEGIYEIYYESERSSGRGALFRLIVRDCPPGKWGPSHCYGICDKCYNGGVCDDKTGQCICPPNFKGQNCLQICRRSGGNRFGLSCEYKCSYSRDSPVKCQGNLFCLPDPLGCTCDVGVKGLDCNTLCDSGEYGAGCTQTCHCNQTECNRYTGCDGVCDSGWSGSNCQIPSVCDVGYYGPDCTHKCHCLNDVCCNKTTGECPAQECSAGYAVYSDTLSCEVCRGAFFGLDCTQSCHCAEAACDPITGHCIGQCLQNWASPSCVIGISEVKTNEAVNPYQAASFSCIVTGMTVPEASDVGFYRYDNDGSINDTGIAIDSSSHDGSERAVTFIVDRVVPGQYLCVLQNPPGPILLANATTYVLPVMYDPPETSTETATTIDLKWVAWNDSEDYTGDPPLVGYTVYHSATSTEVSGEEHRVDPAITSITVRDLEPDTDYMFSVGAVREGPGGTGPESPVATAATLCRKPTGIPFDIRASAERPKELKLTWQIPNTETAQCRSGFIYYTVNVTSNDTDFHQLYIADSKATTFIVDDLGTYTEYSIVMSSFNKDEGSEGSDPYSAMTMEEAPPPPTNVTVINISYSSLLLTWQAATPNNLNGAIQCYNVKYTTTNEDFTGIRQVIETSFNITYNLTGLLKETRYSVEVRTINQAGKGNWSTPIWATTIQGHVDDDPVNNSPVLPWALFGITVVINIVGGVYYYVHRNRSRGSPKGLTRRTSSGMGSERQLGHEYETNLHLYEGVSTPPSVATPHPGTPVDLPLGTDAPRFTPSSGADSPPIYENTAPGRYDSLTPKVETGEIEPHIYQGLNQPPKVYHGHVYQEYAL